MNADEMMRQALRMEYQRGLADGLNRGAASLEMVAAIVPETWTKREIIEHAAREAAKLRELLKQEMGNA